MYVETERERERHQYGLASHGERGEALEVRVWGEGDRRKRKKTISEHDDDGDTKILPTRPHKRQAPTAHDDTVF